MDKKQLLAMYEDLRVTDVVDAMEAFGYFNIGMVDQEIKPLWRDVIDGKHKICGFAFTVRFLPSDKPLNADTPDDYDEKKSAFFSQYADCHKDMEDLSEGDVLVFDCGGISEWGGFGSLFALILKDKKVRGVVTNNSVRDTDELIKMQFPVYCKRAGKGHRCFRSEYDACNVRVNIGETLVCPGDLIVADGDGVAVVPISIAEKVAMRAKDIYEGDDLFVKNMGFEHLIEE